MSDARLFALIACAGSGSRASGSAPKQYRAIGGRPMVEHTLAAFKAVHRIAGLLVIVAPGDTFFAARAGDIDVAACGGSTRAESVGNGLAHLRGKGATDRDWVLVHDAARCLVTPASIDALIDACRDDPVGGLLAHPLADTLKAARGDRSMQTLDRADKWLAQTPQMFRLGPLREALAAAGPGVTDEACAMEAMGQHPLLVPGGAHNFKVTYPEDFALAEAVLGLRQAQPVPSASSG